MAGITKDKFQQLIEQSEGQTLDFKGKRYEVGIKRERYGFVKDVLAMANTPRDTSANIVLGVSWTPESGSEIVGLDRQLDDAELQRAFGQDLVSPLPQLNYTPIEYEGKQVGVVEIPVGNNDSPSTPLKDIDGILQRGAVYYRCGSENARASGPALKGIYDWFRKGDTSIFRHEEEDSWRNFLDAVNGFNTGTDYVLAVDRIPSTESPYAKALGNLSWRAVIDFDPESDATGFLACIKGSTQNQLIHRVAPGDNQQAPKSGIHWYFAQGLPDLQNTKIPNDYRNWRRAYRKDLVNQLERLAGSIAPRPTVAVIIWSNVEQKGYLRALMEELDTTFGDALEVVVVTSSDESQLGSIVEEAEGTLIRIALRNLCHGLAVHYDDTQNVGEKQCVLPMASGALIKLEKDDCLWLEEDLEIIHRAAGLAGDDGAEEYRRGAEVTWRNLHLHHDCDRGDTTRWRQRIEQDLRGRQPLRVNLYHEPGSGGTTIGRRVAWDLHNEYPVVVLQRCMPRETAERIGKIASLTGKSVLVLIDGGKHGEWDIDNLYELLKANHTPSVLFQVLRRFSRHKTGNRQFWLGAQLTDSEADRFRSVYSQSKPEMGRALSNLARHGGKQERTAFLFGLTAFERDFQGLRPYVIHRIAALTGEQKRILVYTAIAYYYGQQSVPAQAFDSLLQLPKSKPVDLAAAFSGTSASALGLLMENRHREWRITHHLIAREILQQVLAPESSQQPEGVWSQNLSLWAKDFAGFCRGDRPVPSDELLKLARRVFIYRGNADVLGTERAGHQRFSQLIDDIPSESGKREVLRHLTECFPDEAHCHAHLGRLLSLQKEFDDALASVDRAISLQPNGSALWHMRGMVFRSRMRENAVAGQSTAQLVSTAKMAAESFEESRCHGPENEYGYISEIQTLLDLVDRAARGRQSAVRDVLAKPETDVFLRQALGKAEDLLDQVQHLYVGETPSNYVLECNARLNVVYGDYSTALEAWDNLLSRPEVVKPPVRRQIVSTHLRRRDGDWGQLTNQEIRRIQGLLEDNLEEDRNDSESLRKWLRIIRQSPAPPSLDAVIERVAYWKMNTNSQDAAYYLYILHTLHALEGSSQGAVNANNALEKCRDLARFRRDRTRSFEWVGPGQGVRALVHESRLGEWQGHFWEQNDVLFPLEGRISNIGGPQKGSILLRGSVEAFFVPGQAGFHSGRDENTPVTCHLGFSYEGPRAWDVRRTEA